MNKTCSLNVVRKNYILQLKAKEILFAPASCSMMYVKPSGTLGMDGLGVQK